MNNKMAIFPLVLATVALAFIPVITYAEARNARRACVLVKNSASSTGDITFEFEAKGGNSKKFTLSVTKGDSAEKVAGRIEDSLRDNIGSGYKYRTNRDGITVCVNKDGNKGTPFLSQRRSRCRFSFDQSSQAVLTF